jgi:hypothetical protein
VVPLEDAGYAVGKIVQADMKGGVTGYFFGPRRPAVPALSELTDLRYEDAVYVSNFGDLGLINGEWSVIGGHDEPDTRDWPTPAFGRLRNPPPQGFRVIYRDDNTNEPASVDPISVEECLALPNDAMDGAGAVRIVLTRLLSGLDIHDRRRKVVESWERRQ